MRLPFTKLHGLGNDFIAVDGRDPALIIDAVVARRLCDRHLGIGADGLLRLTGSLDSPHMTVFNADGSQPEMCGNGIRCFVKWLVDGYAIAGDLLTVQTDAGPRVCRLQRDATGMVQQVAVEMGRPTLVPAAIPAVAHQVIIGQPVTVADRQLSLTAVGIGNPHVAIFEPLSAAERQLLGPQVAALPLFPAGVNVEFCELLQAGPDAARLRVDVLERGCGWTQACGTGATAAAFAAVQLGHVEPDRPVDVRLPGGWLRIAFRADGEAIMTGPAVAVFKGEMIVD